MELIATDQATAPNSASENPKQTRNFQHQNMNVTFFQKKEENTTQIYTKETKSQPIRHQTLPNFDSNPQSQNTQQTRETIPSNNYESL